MSPFRNRRFEDLGLYRILDRTGDRPEAHDFVMEWLGPLLSYDRKKKADLVMTLTQYLDCGGNYDAWRRSRSQSTEAPRIVRVAGAPLPPEGKGD